MNSVERKSDIFIIRKPLWAYFVLSYAFFWGFLVLIIVILSMLRLRPDALPAWLEFLPYVIMAFIVILIWKPDKLSRPPVRAVPQAIE